MADKDDIELDDFDLDEFNFDEFNMDSADAVDDRKPTTVIKDSAIEDSADRSLTKTLFVVPLRSRYQKSTNPRLRP